MCYNHFMKKISKMEKDELILLALEHELEVDDSMTNDELRATISDAGIDDDTLLQEEQAKQSEREDRASTAPAETEDEVLIRMMTKTKRYSFGSYTLTRDNHFEVMKMEDAEKIIYANPETFRKASEEEIRRFFG